MQAVLRRMIEEGHQFDFESLSPHEERMGQKRPPDWHMSLPSDLSEAQFRFWWRNILLFADAAVRQDPGLLPDEEAIEHQAWQVGGTPEMSSFTAKEFSLLNQALDPYRNDADGMHSSQVMTELLVPRLIAVELDWQAGEKYRRYDNRRPRTDEGSDRESVWLRYSRAVHAKAMTEKPLTSREAVYLDIAAFVQWAETNEPNSKLVQDYSELLYAYNRNHETAPVESLYK